MPLSVLFVMFIVPEFEMAPPLPPVSPPSSAVLPLSVQLIMFTMPELKLKIPPPLTANPLLMVMPEMVITPGAVTVTVKIP